MEQYVLTEQQYNDIVDKILEAIDVAKVHDADWNTFASVDGIIEPLSDALVLLDECLGNELQHKGNTTMNDNETKTVKEAATTETKAKKVVEATKVVATITPEAANEVAPTVA